MLTFTQTLATYQQEAAAAKLEDISSWGSLPHYGEPIQLNGNIAVTCAILKLVASSAAEAELGALFLNTKKA